MKYSLILLLFVAQIHAQTITKTYVLGSDSLTYFEVVTVTQEDESATTTKTRVGPAAALNDLADKIEAQTQNISAQAYEISKINSRISEIAATDAAIPAISGSSPLKAIQARHAAELLTPGWQIDQGAGFVSLVFTINGSNNLRYSISGAATKAATPYGNIITLGSYPANGTNTDFYLSENGRQFFSLPNRAVKIKKPGQ